MTSTKLVLLLACLATAGLATGALATGALVGNEAKVTTVLSKDLMDIPGKEGLMLTVEYPPGGSDPIHRHNAHAFVYVTGRLDRDAGARRKGNDFDTWADLL